MWVQGGSQLHQFSILLAADGCTQWTKLSDNAPIAYVSWAKLSDTTIERYKTAPHHLTSNDWQSGDQVWIIDLFAPFGQAQEVMKDLREVVFKGLPVHQLIPSAVGQAKTMTWPAVL